MARPLRIEYPGALYHVTARGNARGDIYLSDTDRAQFLARLREACDRFGWLCHAYCLMSNHYHLLIETPEPTLSRGMRHLNGVYTQDFNRAHGRVGHVLQGRYKAILVEREAHLLELCRYIVLNPVRANMVKRAGDWRWSSYGETAGRVRPTGLLSTTWLLAQFGAEPKAARRAYGAFVADGGEAYRPWEALKGGAVLGGAAFRGTIAKKMSAEKAGVEMRGSQSEVPRGARYLGRPSLERLKADMDETERGAWMTAAYREHGYTMAQIGEAAGLHYSSVSKVIKAHERSSNSRFKTRPLCARPLCA